ncbi:MAG TPA: hypothetical protein VF792_02100 [Ktedonobacterales bacterium]
MDEPEVVEGLALVAHDQAPEIAEPRGRCAPRFEIAGQSFQDAF